MKNATKKLLCLLILLLITIFVWQEKSSAQTSEQNLSATANFKADEAIAPETAIEVTLNRKLQTTEKIAVTIEQTDLTSLFSNTENKFIYNAKVVPLPIGNSNLTVYVVNAVGAWKEISRLTLLVQNPKSEVQSQETSANNEMPKTEENKPDETAKTNAEESKSQTNKNAESVKTDETKAETTKPEEAKTEEGKSETKPEERPQTTETTEKKSSFNFIPTLTLSLKSQPFQSNFPLENRPAERATSTDFTLQGSIKNEYKFGGISSDSNFDFAGSSFKQEALRFGELGDKAPNVDLSSYLLNFQVGKAKFSYGHTSFGNSRHLVSSFSARGLSVNIPINSRFDITGGVLNGTSIVGFGNFFGLRNFDHQVQGVTLGIEIFPKRQNALRVEISGFNGYIQPLNNVSEGRINDAEQSRGGSLRLVTQDKTERFKLEFGFTLSRFQNPADTSLDPDGNAVPIAAVSRTAHYLDASYQVLKDVKLTKTKSVNLNFSFRHEFVEPLFKSLGASASADKTAQDYALDGTIGDIALQFGHTCFNDNLSNVPSILKSLTRANRFSVALPVSAFIGKSDKPSPFFPRLAYSIDQTHQFGAGIPVNGGFEIDLSTIPDQVNTNQNFSSAWQFSKFNFEYRYNRSVADNRQTGRETADQIGFVHGVSVGVNPLAIFGFTVGLNFENSNNLELAQVNKTKALTFGVNLQPFKGATFSGNFSNTLAGDAAKTNNNKNINFDMQFAYNFNLEKSKFKKFGMQTFIRFADTFSRNRDFIADVNNRTRTKIINAGLTFNFF